MTVGQPLLSIVIPTYNGESFIEETIRSVFAQTFGDWELIITDDQSSDKTIELAQKLISDDSRCRIIHNTDPSGPVVNWNHGLHFAQGKYFKLLCQDDILDNTCLEQQVEILERYDDIKIVSGPRRIINSRGKKILLPKVIFDGRQQSKNVVLRSILKGSNLIGEPSFVMFETESLRKRNGFSENWKYLVDLATYESVLQNEDIYFVDSIQGSFRISRESWSHSLTRQQLHEFMDFSHYVLEKHDMFTKRTLRKVHRASFIRSHLRHLLFRIS